MIMRSMRTFLAKKVVQLRETNYVKTKHTCMSRPGVIEGS